MEGRRRGPTCVFLLLGLSILFYFSVGGYISQTWSLAPKPIKKPGCFLGKFCINYLMNPQGFCMRKSPLKALFFVLIKMDDFQRRSQIRRTWGNASVLEHTTSYQVVFLLGVSANYTQLLVELRTESALHNDLIVVDVKEDYETLTHKSLSGLHWASHFCPDATFVVKVDQDIFINTFAFMDTLSALEEKNRTTGVLMGHVFTRMKVPRGGKYHVAWRDFWPSVFPRYLGGAVYVLSADVAATLTALAMSDPAPRLLRLEDAYITGVLAARARLRPVVMKPGTWVSWPMKGLPKDHWERYFVWHHILSPTQEIELWNRIRALHKRA